MQGADQGDTSTIAETVTAAAEELEAAVVATGAETAVIEEVVADKGYHSNQVLVDLAALALRTYIAEPDRGRRQWTTFPAAHDAIYANRQRIRGPRAAAPQRVIWNGRTRISTKLAACAAQTSWATRTS